VRTKFFDAASDDFPRSKTVNNHLLQNYFITLVPESNLRPIFPLADPWSSDVTELFKRLNTPVRIEDMQVDYRLPGERARGVISF
jgi:hypothetical protein